MSDRQLIDQLSVLTTEQLNPSSNNLDTLTTAELINVINREDAKVHEAVAHVSQRIAEFVDALVANMRRGGRLIYLGAGTSGRLGVLDAVECPPTFSTPDSLVVGLIAGGERAMYKAVEGAEDSEDCGRAELASLGLSSVDTVVGIAASGRTPYVMGALAYARSVGVTTAAVCCNLNTPVGGLADFPIEVDVGPEVLTGSTRMKAGTAQKMILNMISTAAMVQLGKTFKNLMVDVKATNAKLKARGVRIITMATGASIEAAQALLEQGEGDVKTAILIYHGHSKDHAQALLKINHGDLSACLT